MNGKNFRTLYYFITLLVITVIFIIAGLYLIGKEQKTETGARDSEDTPAEESPIQEDVVNQSDQDEDDELSPDQVLYVSAVEDFENKNYQEAINKLNQAIAANPNNSGYYSLKSEAEILLSQLEEAKKTLEAGITANPDSEILNSKLDTLEKEYFFPEDQEATRG